MIDAGTEVEDDKRLRGCLITEVTTETRLGFTRCNAVFYWQLRCYPAGNNVVDIRIGGWRADLKNSDDQRTQDNENNRNDCIGLWQEGVNQCLEERAEGDDGGQFESIFQKELIVC